MFTIVEVGKILGGVYMTKKNKRRLLIGAIIAAMMLTVTGCTLEDGDSDSKESSKDSLSSLEDSKSKDDSKDENESKDSDDKKDTSGKPTIEEQVLWEADGVKMTATGIDEDSIWGTEIKVLVENNSDKDVTIGANAIIVNDYMVTDLTSISVSAGKKANDKITLSSTELEAAGINNIGKVEMYLYTYDPDTYDTISESDCITLKTSEFDNIDNDIEIKGTTLFDKDGIKIVAQYVDEDSFWGSAVLLYIENNTKKNFTVQCEDVSVNGFMVSALMSSEIFAGKKSFTDITLLQSDLEENSITSIDEIETSFTVFDDDFNDIANTGKVSFKVK